MAQKKVNPGVVKAPARKAQVPGKHIKPVAFKGLFIIFSIFFLLFIPIFYYSPAMDITLMPRLFLISIFLLIMSFVFFSGKNKNLLDYSPLRSMIFPIILIYLLLTIFSITWAINHKESFFDMVRTSVFLWVIIFSALLFMKHEGWQEKVPKYISITAIVSVLVGLVQYVEKVVNGPAMLPDHREAIYAVVGVMSHKNEFSNALMLMLPFLFYGIYSLRKEWRVVSILAVALNLIMILLLKTRSVWVGIAISLLMTGIFLVFSGHRVKLHKTWRIVLAASIIALVTGVAVIYSLPKRTDDFSIVGRVQNIADTQSPHNISRLKVWHATLQMISERPFYKGVGAGNWQILIAPYCKGMFTSISALNWGRPHNDFLWVWSEKGIFGLILYLSIFVMGFYYLFRVFFFSPDTKDRMLAILIAGGILAYLAISFFSFPYERMNHTVYLSLYLAAAVVLHRKAFPVKREFKPNPRYLLAAGLLMCGFGVIYGYQATRMEIYMKRTIQAENNNRFNDAIHWAQKSINPFRSLNPMAYPPEYYIAKSDAAMHRNDEALEGFRKTLELFPGNAWAYSRMGLIYSEKKDLDSLIYCLDYILELVPNLKKERKALASAWYQKGNYLQSMEELKKIPGYKKDREIIRNMKFLEETMAKEEKDKEKKKETRPQNLTTKSR
jgi:O-antigen ligase